MGACWEEDGVGCGGHYLDTKIDGVRAGVHDYVLFAECQIWTPGCGFAPAKTVHLTVAEAKQHAEQRLAMFTGGAA